MEADEADAEDTEMGTGGGLPLLGEAVEGTANADGYGWEETADDDEGEEDADGRGAEEEGWLSAGNASEESAERTVTLLQ